VAFATLNGTWLGLYEREALAVDATVPVEDRGFESFAIPHNVHTQEAVDEKMNQAMVAGATLVKAPQTVSDCITLEQGVLPYSLKKTCYQ
jgi:hypothetical protein